MAKITVQAEERQEVGKGPNRRLRTQGKIPAVLYGRGLETLSVSVNSGDVDQILCSETGHNTIFKLQVGSNSTDVLIRDYQLDPVKGILLHADFQAVALDRKMTFAVPVQTMGTASGVTAGGVLDIVLREIELECFPLMCRIIFLWMSPNLRSVIRSEWKLCRSIFPRSASYLFQTW